MMAGPGKTIIAIPINKTVKPMTATITRRSQLMFGSQRRDKNREMRDGVSGGLMRSSCSDMSSLSKMASF